jgi:hypothetical protein
MNEWAWTAADTPLGSIRPTVAASLSTSARSGLGVTSERSTSQGPTTLLAIRLASIREPSPGEPAAPRGGAGVVG